MKIKTMMGDLLQSLFRKPATEQYPFERRTSPDRLRGKLHWTPEKCTGCCLCSMECPANAIELITLDKADKKFVLKYYIDRCTFCEQCVQNCRFGCLGMSNREWELAALSREAFTVHYGEETNVTALLAKLAEASPEPAGA